MHEDHVFREAVLATRHPLAAGATPPLPDCARRPATTRDGNKPLGPRLQTATVPNLGILTPPIFGGASNEPPLGKQTLASEDSRVIESAGSLGPMGFSTKGLLHERALEAASLAVLYSPAFGGRRVQDHASH